MRSPITLTLPSSPNYRGCKPGKSSRQADYDAAGALPYVFPLFSTSSNTWQRLFAGKLFPQLMKGSCLPLAAFEAQTFPPPPLPSRPRNLLMIYDYLDKWRAERGWGEEPRSSLPKRGGPGSPRLLTRPYGGPN